MVGKPVILLFDGFSPARFGHESCPVLALKRLTARLAQGLFANGMVGSSYLRDQLRVPSERSIHNQFLSHSASPINDAHKMLTGMNKAQIRQRLGIEDDGRFVLMTCGYLIQRKRIDLIIDAIARQPEISRPLLLIVGNGELAHELRDRAKRSGVPAHFAGFKLGQELAAYYLAADGFVLASSDDPWGLVINEAMSVGLPVLVSDACGASLDLVRDGVNGFTFRTGDAESLSAALIRLRSADLIEMGKTSRSIIAAWTPLQSAQSLCRVVDEVTCTLLHKD
jgi:glycosyltransferase involved in cell wall biosynthesis